MLRVTPEKSLMMAMLRCRDAQRMLLRLDADMSVIAQHARRALSRDADVTRCHCRALLIDRYATPDACHVTPGASAPLLMLRTVYVELCYD